MTGRVTNVIVGASLCAMIATAATQAVAAPKQVVADLSNSSVDITSSYHGTELLLFGAYEGRAGDDIVLIVQGPPTDIIQRRKEKRAGIWVNGETVTWQEAPSFYHMFSTSRLDNIAEPSTLAKAMVGPLSVNLKLVRGARGDDTGHGGAGRASITPASFGNKEEMDGLRRNMEANGLWLTMPSSITTQQDMLFRAALALPSNIPPGDYVVRVLHFRDGVAMSERTTDMNVKKAGFSALIYRFAHDHSALYGIFAIIFAVASGWLAAVAFRRG